MTFSIEFKWNWASTNAVFLFVFYIFCLFFFWHFSIDRHWHCSFVCLTLRLTMTLKLLSNISVIMKHRARFSWGGIKHHARCPTHPGPSAPTWGEKYYYHLQWNMIWYLLKTTSFLKSLCQNGTPRQVPETLWSLRPYRKIKYEIVFTQIIVLKLMEISVLLPTFVSE